MARYNDTAKKKAAFLAAIAQKYSIYHSAQVAGVPRMTVYRWREKDATFAAAMDAAREDAADVLETSMFERAIAGDTTAGIFMLKAMRPAQYRETTRTINIQLSSADLAAMSDDDLADLERKLTPPR